MKAFFVVTLWACLLAGLPVLAQPTCGTPSPTAEQARLHEEKFREFVLKAKAASRGRVQAQNVAVKVWIVKPTNGQYFDMIPQLPDVLTSLNKVYAPIGITFYYPDAATTILDPGNLYSIRAAAHLPDLIQETLWKKYHVDNALNLYFTGEISEGITGFSGISTIPSAIYNTNKAKDLPLQKAPNFSNWVVISTTELYSKQKDIDALKKALAEKLYQAIPHEVGHYFNLYHTFADRDANGVLLRDLERIDGSNCNDAGDFICDTPADPFSDTNKGTWKYCEYDFNSTEPGTGLRYNPMFWNIMSYYRVSEYYFDYAKACGQKVPQFTLGQYDRMQGGLLYRTTTHPNPSQRYYLDGQKHLATDDAPTELCPGAAITTKLYWQGTFYSPLYLVQFIDQATGKVAAFLENQYLIQKVENGQNQPSGELRFTVPASLPAGTYKMRFLAVADAVATLSSTVQVKAPNTARLTGTATIQERDSTQLKVDLTGGLPATVTLTNGQQLAATTTPYAFFVKPTRTTTYRLASVSNGCGVGTVGPDEVTIAVIPITATAPPVSAVRVYPNPATAAVRVEAASTTGIVLKLLDATGRAVLERTVFEQTTELPLSGVEAGLYLLRVTTGKQEATFKIVKH